MRCVFGNHGKTAFGHSLRMAAFNARSGEIAGVEARRINQLASGDQGPRALDYKKNSACFSWTFAGAAPVRYSSTAEYGAN